MIRFNQITEIILLSIRIYIILQEMSIKLQGKEVDYIEK